MRAEHRRGVALDVDAQTRAGPCQVNFSPVTSARLAWCDEEEREVPDGSPAGSGIVRRTQADLRGQQTRGSSFARAADWEFPVGFGSLVMGARWCRAQIIMSPLCYFCSAATLSRQTRDSAAQSRATTARPELFFVIFCGGYSSVAHDDETVIW